MKIVPITQPEEKLICQHSECKVIRMNDYEMEDLDDEMNAAIGMGFDFQFLNVFYFVPVALLLSVIYPVIYIFIVFHSAKVKIMDVLMPYSKI